MSRYIDADKLQQAYKEIHGGKRSLLIDTEPTADVRENVKGEWILHIDDLFPEESTMECNQCHEHQPVTIDDNFCPNCGAQMMRGEDGEHE